LNPDDVKICSLCGEQILYKKNLVPFWVHEIIDHWDSWEEKTNKMSKDVLIDVLYDIIEYYHAKTIRAEDLK